MRPFLFVKSWFNQMKSVKKCSLYGVFCITLLNLIPTLERKHFIEWSTRFWAWHCCTKFFFGPRAFSKILVVVVASNCAKLEKRDFKQSFILRSKVSIMNCHKFYEIFRTRITRNEKIECRYLKSVIWHFLIKNIWTCDDFWE